MTVEKVKNVIEKLEAINPENEYAYEKAVLAYLTIGRLPVLLYDIPEKSVFFRTRTHEKDDLFQSISEISITPNHFVKNFARCNRPFQSKFYCSENRPTSFAELVEYWSETKEVNDKVYVTIGRWQLTKPFRGIIVTTPDKENRVSEFDKEHGAVMETFIEQSDLEMREAIILFYRFLFEKFRKSSKHDPKTYIITTAYCNVALAHSEGKADGIYYPSVPFGGQGVNLAINSEFIKNLELTHVLRNELTVSKNGNDKHEFTETGKIDASSFSFAQNLIQW
ncbi:RES domain-containing protein [Flavobacterium sp. ov086]|uniref:RES domain-containing protein n=1 Tax=Flavobacterium sp. ov086 TaxID=1761785 RepID=UPI000B704C7B|nr:RES domain-containing protein [Flavobacterium sp. ov086]SNR25012.1 RES domain-containing protein [Flavobacterium sp. ov086]